MVRRSMRQRLGVLLQAMKDMPHGIRWRVNPEFRTLRSGQYTFNITEVDMIPRDVTAAVLKDVLAAVRRFIIQAINYVILAETLTSSAHIQIVMEAFPYFISTPWKSLGATRNRVGTHAEKLLDAFVRKVQSAELVDLTSSSLVVKYLKPMAGGAYIKNCLNYEQFVKKKRCVLPIRAVDNNCFFQCMVLAQLRLKDKKKYEELKKKRNLKRLQDQAAVLREEFKDVPEGEPMPLDKIRDYERMFELSITVINFYGMRYIHTGLKEYDTKIFLLFHDGEESAIGHYDLLDTNHISALWNKRRYCYKCEKAYNDISHRCIEKCRACHRDKCNGVGQSVNNAIAPILCGKCNMIYYDQGCFKNHEKYMCKWSVKCLQCELIYERKKEHRCGEVECRNCHEWTPITVEHECYVQPLTEDNMSEVTDKYIFYDYECFLDSDKPHQVAGVVAMYFDSNKFYRFTTHNDFIEWLFQDKHKGYTCIAHNGGRYDFHFIKKEMLRRGIKSSDVANGNTIFYSKVKDFDMRFIDSYRFILGGLRTFPKTFGLTEITKGYFPYTFFTTATKNYEGPMPDITHFGFDGLKPKDRAEALAWYAEHKEDTINLYEMCMKYCESDVMLLKQGCVKYRQLFLDITQGEIDPFQKITIASVCMDIYKRFHLPTNAIAILNPPKYDIDYWNWKNWMHGNIAGLVEDIDINGVTVDIYDKATDICYFFFNCIDKGCSLCFPNHAKHPITGVKFLRVRHEAKENLVQLKKTKVIMKQCEWLDRKEVFCPVENEPLDARDAFFGGRTEPVQLYRKTVEGETIKYADYTSLYPSVQYGLLNPITDDGVTTRCEYPIGHPTRISHPKSLNGIYGFAKVKVTPPKNLHLPLLPEKKGGKLMFDLTPKVGTWTTLELNKAIDLGYRIDHIYEALHFEEKSDTLFRGYVETFLKIKQQAAGWKKLGCTTDDEKAQYVEDYRINQNIRLDPTKIGEYNPGLYFIAKICLNSLWGKFGQRAHFGQTTDVFDDEAFGKIVFNCKNIVNNVIMHDHGARTIMYEKMVQFESPSKNTNIAVAAFTTSFARLRLYEALEVLGKDVLYMDTDSVIYMDRGQLNMGPYLGDLTDELEGDTITEFVSTGPKSYGYITQSGKQELKVKGFTLNFAAKKTLNFNTLKTMICEDQEHTATVRPLQFKIATSHEITTPNMDKVFRYTFDKRNISEVSDYEVQTAPKAQKQ